MKKSPQSSLPPLVQLGQGSYVRRLHGHEYPALTYGVALWVVLVIVSFVAGVLVGVCL